MSLFEDTNPRALKELLGEIHSRVAVLPDFQRDFVWEPGATQELIVSIAYNYPAGSILRVRDMHQVFAAREFEGAPKLGEHKYTFLVLDGQQRLTSLYQAFYGVGDHRYYLDLRKLMAGMDFEDAIFYARATTKWAQAREDFELQAAELILPLSVLRGGAGQFGQWSRKVARQLPDQDRIALEDTLDVIEERWIRIIDDYHFPVVTLSSETKPDALCTIFETLNRTGVKLSVFELLTARFWPQNIRLRDLWQAAQDSYPIIADFEVDPYYVLQAIALACRKNPSCKRGDVLELTAADIVIWWPKVIAGLATGLTILRDDCKVMLPRWLPYNTMLVPFAAVLAKVGLPNTPAAGAQRELLKRWFWCAVFSQAYESSPNSQAARDVTELQTWLAGGTPPEVVSTFRFDPKTLRDVTPRQRSIYRGTICLILGAGTRDFHTQAVVTGKMMLDEGIDDHHIFPAKYLEKTGVAQARLRDCVLNRTLIDRTTNQMISDRAPSVYMSDIRNTPGFPFDAVLASHYLPIDVASPLIINDFDAFLLWREQQLWQQIKNVTGVEEATDLEIDMELLEEAGSGQKALADLGPFHVTYRHKPSTWLFQSETAWGVEITSDGTCSLWEDQVGMHSLDGSHNEARVFQASPQDIAMLARLIQVNGVMSISRQDAETQAMDAGYQYLKLKIGDKVGEWETAGKMWGNHSDRFESIIAQIKRIADAARQPR
jgi:hypothetical protein